MRTRDTLALIAAVVVSESAGLIGSLFTAPAIPAWYAYLVKPSFAPPNWVFGPVWTTLYALMGVAAFLVWRQGWHRREVRVALGVFLLQLALNTAWSFMFFGLRSPGAAFAEIVFLWVSIVATMATSGRVSKPAAWLLAPYIAWVTFAACLNYAIWTLN